MTWFTKTVEDVAKQLDTSVAKGLVDSNATNRLQTHGFNELKEAKKASTLRMFLVQFKNPLLIILLLGGGLSFYTGHLVDGIAIIVIVFINAIISFLQEYKAQKSLESLKDMAAPNAMVLRDEKWQSVPAKTLVPGDILKLNTGDVVAADVRLVEVNRLQIDESSLTGESEPVDKEIEPLDDKDAGIGDRTNMAFMTTIVSGGNGIGIVCDTSMSTEVGHIAHLMQSTEAMKTPMQVRMDTLSHILIGAALAVVAGVVGIGLNHGADWMEMLQTGISLSVAAIPEGLPTVLTIVLTLGSKRMVESKALVRKLASVETLGSTSVICSDKTGTLTQNQMQVVSMWSEGLYWNVTGQGFDPEGAFIDKDGKETDVEQTDSLKYALMISAICNDSALIKKDGRYAVQGNPTEGALVVAAQKGGISKKKLLENGVQILKSFPFDSTRKMSSVIVRLPNGDLYSIAKGAPDVVLRKANQIRWDGERKPLIEEYQNSVQEAIGEFGERALRTLAIAFKQLDTENLELPQEEYEKDLVLLAIHGIIDPPRPEVVDAVDQCWSAGIKTVMITGDHAATAEAIAKDIGIKRNDDDLVITGTELDKMSDRDLEKCAPNASVFARVSPEHKMRIVKALQANNQVVAMTGDGVNDAPALRNADIGVAMGIAGTQVAKDSAALVLLDDNFSTIVSAVKEGRRIYDNLKKFLRQALTANVAEVSSILFAFMLMGDNPVVPLSALMILWINLVSDGLPALALGVDSPENDLMQRKPRLRDESLFADNLGIRIVLRGLALGWLTYFMFEFALKKGFPVEYAQSASFLTLVFAQLFHIFDARTFTSLYRKNPFTNKYLILAVVGSALASIAMVYLPFGNLVLGTAPLQFKHLIMIMTIASLPTFILSGIKEVFRLSWI